MTETHPWLRPAVMSVRPSSDEPSAKRVEATGGFWGPAENGRIGLQAGVL